MPIHANRKAIIAKNKTLYESASGDWKITSDAGFIEFVTEPFEEEGERPETGRMVRAVQEMAACMDNLYQAARKNYEKQNTPLKDVLGGGVFTKHDDDDPYIPNDYRVCPPAAKPQVTGGVHLENIVALSEATYNTELPLNLPTNPMEMELFDDPPELRKASAKRPVSGCDFVKEAGLLVKAELLASDYVRPLRRQGVQGVEKLRGMLTLVYSYLLAGSRQEKVQSQAKYFMPMMSRMSFAGMYASLPREMQDAFDPEMILSGARLDPSEPVYKFGFLDKTHGDSQVKKGPARKRWLESIMRGRDLMSAEGGTSVTRGTTASSPAMGQHQMLDPDHKGNTNQLVQIELRRLPGSVSPEEWTPLALALFEMFQRVQASKKG